MVQGDWKQAAGGSQGTDGHVEVVYVSGRGREPRRGYSQQWSRLVIIEVESERWRWGGPSERPNPMVPGLKER